MSLKSKSLDGAVGIATGYGLHDHMVGVRIRVVYQTGTGASFPSANTAGA
jgi:hypothetical protein